jgi:hypothetical protein
MSLTQGGALPSIDTTQTQSTTAPAFYTDYLNNLAQAGTAGGNAQYVGATPMQNQAYSLAQQNVGNYQPTLSTAQGDLSQVTNYDPTQASAGALNMALGQNAVGAAQPYLQQGASTNVLGAAQPYLNSAANPTYNTVQNYMNPYVNDVVSQIGDLAEQNIMQNVAPQTTAGLVGSGQFGSQRGAQALANTLGQYGQQTTAAQTNALNTGYQNAMNQAQAQAALQGQLGQTAGTLANYGAQNQLSAGSTLGQLTNTQQANEANIGNIQGNMASQEQQNLINAGIAGGNLAAQTQQLGLNDVNALSTLGGQQQQIAQNQQLFPLQTAAAQANILRGYTIPTSVQNQYSGPIPGAYQSAPLSQIAGIGSLLGSTQGQTLMSSIGNLFGSNNGNPSQATLNAANASSDPLGSLIAAQTGQTGQIGGT